jgi:hypothetical protein
MRAMRRARADPTFLRLQRPRQARHGKKAKSVGPGLLAVKYPFSNATPLTPAQPMLKLFNKKAREGLRISMLRRLSPFATLSSSELRVVDSLLHERHYLKGEIVFDAGEEGQALYAIISGRVLVCRQGEPETGRIAELEAGMAFGELALLDNAPRSAQTRAAQDCTLASLSRSDFESLLDTHAVVASKIALQLARQFGRQLRERHSGHGS